jgi:hypothetical protein
VGAWGSGGWSQPLWERARNEWFQGIGANTLQLVAYLLKMSFSSIKITLGVKKVLECNTHNKSAQIISVSHSQVRTPEPGLSTKETTSSSPQYRSLIPTKLLLCPTCLIGIAHVHILRAKLFCGTGI